VDTPRPSPRTNRTRRVSVRAGASPREVSPPPRTKWTRRACPVSTRGGTRLVQLVQEGRGGGGGSPREPRRRAGPWAPNRTCARAPAQAPAAEPAGRNVRQMSTVKRSKRGNGREQNPIYIYISLASITIQIPYKEAERTCRRAGRRRPAPCLPACAPRCAGTEHARRRAPPLCARRAAPRAPAQRFRRAWAAVGGRGGGRTGG